MKHTIIVQRRTTVHFPNPFKRKIDQSSRWHSSGGTTSLSLRELYDTVNDQDLKRANEDDKPCSNGVNLKSEPIRLMSFAFDAGLRSWPLSLSSFSNFMTRTYILRYFVNNTQERTSGLSGWFMTLTMELARSRMLISSFSATESSSVSYTSELNMHESLPERMTGSTDSYSRNCHINSLARSREYMN